MYLALEPIVRRNLPDLIVSWNRLLVGDWRDPLVGRDVLLGTLWGIAHLTLIYLGFSAERLFYNDFRLFTISDSLIGLRSSTAIILTGSGLGIVYGFMFICFLVILFLILRRRLYAGIVLFAVLATVLILFFTHSFVFLPFTLAISVLFCLVISRLGLVATIVSQSVFLWLQSTPFTLNFSAWYAGGMFVTVFLVLPLLAYGFKVSLANQPLFGDHFAKE
jgi:serine/threonine-protein kinase